MRVFVWEKSLSVFAHGGMVMDRVMRDMSDMESLAMSKRNLRAGLMRTITNN